MTGPGVRSCEKHRDWSSQIALPPEAGDAVANDHEMIMDHDVEISRGLRQAPGHRAIGRRRYRIARGMIVDEKHGGRADLKAPLHDLAGVDLHRGSRANGHEFICDELICRVEEQNSKAFDRIKRHGEPQIIEERRLVRENRTASKAASQHMIDRKPDRSEGLFDRRGAVEDRGARAGCRCERGGERAETSEQLLCEIGRAVGVGKFDQCFQGTSTPVVLSRRRCRHVAAIIMNCASQLHIAVASIYAFQWTLGAMIRPR